MKILFIGDIVGEPGRNALSEHMNQLKSSLSPDMIIANAENSAHGFGLTEKICKGLYELGVDCITTGNHVWDQREMLSYIDRDKSVIRAANFPDGAPGQGGCVKTLQNGKKILVLHLMGRLFMDAMDDPFTCADKYLSKYKLGSGIDAIFIDFHAEATSEKMAFAHYVDGRVSGVVGTHTHVPTADAQILEGGTAFQCDAGMTGNYNSVIGMDKKVPVERFVKKVPGKHRMSPAKGEGTVCGVFLQTDDITGLAKEIRPIRIGPRLISTD